MVPFAGYNMPVQYEGVNVEHETVRTGVGVFDVSHMGEFFLKGENALALIQKVTSNDASKLVDGKAQYSCLPNNEGGIVDDLIEQGVGSDFAKHLKRLVESHELIEQYNGLFEAKELIRVSPKLTSELRGLAAAIADVESSK